MFHTATKPKVAENLALDSATTSSIKVKWDSPSSGDWTGFKVKLLEEDTEIETKTTVKEITTAEFTSLMPATKYTVELYALSGTLESTKVAAQFTTRKYDDFC